MHDSSSNATPEEEYAALAADLTGAGLAAGDGY
jgi:hypothetical protein